MAGPSMTRACSTPGASPTGPSEDASGAVSGLDQWLAVHGPLSWPVALTLGIHACSRASRLPDRHLGASLASLRTAGFTRSGSDGWVWGPVASSSPPRRASDVEVVERVGAVLYECLTAQPLTHRVADEREVLDRLRAWRADLPEAVAELVARAVAPSGGSDVSLARLAVDLRAALGLAQRPHAVGRRWIVAGSVTLLGLLAMAGALRGRDRAATEPGSHGLTPAETTAHDVNLEAADGLAVVDEHTAALQLLQEIDRRLFQRLGVSDPRLDWHWARHAWVRRLAGDLITAEQYLERLPHSLEQFLGRDHPYTRTARLDLAAVLAVRGEQAVAGLRAEAARGAADLWRAPALGWDYAAEAVPWAPHVIAHVAPNVPEREGFRRQPGGGFFVPVTGTQRLMAGRDGWHLHVRAEDTCRVSVVVGVAPREVTVDLRRNAGGAWRVGCAGVTPGMAFDLLAGEPAALTLSVGSDGEVQARTSDGTRRLARIDPVASPPAPPYAVSFSGDRDGAGCAIVWWEITPR